MSYPKLKDETNPVQAHYAVSVSDSGNTVALRDRVESLPDTGEKVMVTPDVGVELFRLGMLTDKVSQFHLLASGNPRPETTAISPLYQIGRNIADFQLPIADLRKTESDSTAVG
jgi:hypothetical protein